MTFKFYRNNLNIPFLVDVMLWWIWGDLQKGHITFKYSSLSYNPLWWLKPRICDKRLYGTGTSGLMLIPLTHPTQCVAECGFSGQANTTLGPSPKRSPIMPIQYGRLNYIGAYVRTKCTSQNLSRTCNRVVAYRDCLTHKPITAQHLVLPDASALAYRDWLCDGGWTLGMGQWDIYIFLRWDQCLTHVLTRGIRTHTNFTSEWST